MRSWLVWLDKTVLAAGRLTAKATMRISFECFAVNLAARA